MRLLLIRHGQTQSNVDHLLDTAYPGAPLNEHGHQQAKRLVESLAAEPIGAVAASPLTRAQQTAQPLATALGLPIHTLDGLKEIQAGVEEMSTDWATYIDVLYSWGTGSPEAKLPEGESGNEFVARFDTAVTELEALGHDTVAAVSHGAAIRTWSGYRSSNVTPPILNPLDNTDVVLIVGSTQQGWRLERWGNQPFD